MAQPLLRVVSCRPQAWVLGCRKLHHLLHVNTPISLADERPEVCAKLVVSCGCKKWISQDRGVVAVDHSGTA